MRWAAPTPGAAAGRRRGLPAREPTADGGGAHGGEGVDFILERGPEVVDIEVKMSAEIREHDLNGRLRLGVVLLPGRRAVAFDSRTIAVPLSAFFGRDAR